MAAQPLKRSKALMPLSREHHFDLLLAWKIRQGLANGTSLRRIAAYIRHIDDKLIKRHFRDEEELLFLPLVPDDRLCERAIHEHAAISQMIEETGRPAVESHQLFSRLADAIESHVRFEERELFAHLETAISRERLQELEKIMAKTHGEFRDNWEDAFWERSRT